MRVTSSLSVHEYAGGGASPEMESVLLVIPRCLSDPTRQGTKGASSLAPTWFSATVEGFIPL